MKNLDPFVSVTLSTANHKFSYKVMLPRRTPKYLKYIAMFLLTTLILWVLSAAFPELAGFFNIAKQVAEALN